MADPAAPRGGESALGAPKLDQEGFPWPDQLTWRCPRCNTRSYCHIHESKPDGSYGPGPKIRCLHCKDVFAPPSTDEKPEFADTAGEIAWLECALRGRDNFIVQRGLWQDFVETLPPNSPAWKDEQPGPDAEAMLERRDLGPEKYALGRDLKAAFLAAPTWEDFAERAAAVLARLGGRAPAAQGRDALREVVTVYLATIDAPSGPEHASYITDLSDYHARVMDARKRVRAALAEGPAGDGSRHHRTPAQVYRSAKADGLRMALGLVEGEETERDAKGMGSPGRRLIKLIADRLRARIGALENAEDDTPPAPSAGQGGAA